MARGMNDAALAKKQALLEVLESMSFPVGVKAIPLTRGLYALIDEADYGWLMKWQWHARNGDSKSFYATRAEYGRGEDGSRKRSSIQMHNAIMNPPEGMEVDHINHNPLDNRRINLRVCIHAHNMRNLPKPRNGRTSSPYKGVSWHKNHECWQAMIKLNYKQKWLGNFTDPKEAALAYNRAAVECFGEFAKLNIVEAA